ncbi:hypothetical protein [Streptomyces sp. NPDC101206]|uniref:hypothetical protein n=1 Tax=Streptomyces sp. NPDC101206 TaxID=3366128 RepID=UPI003824AD78
MEKSVEQERSVEAASNVYERVLAEDRRVIREALRSSRSAAHVGMVLTVVALGLLGYVKGLQWPLIIDGVFVSWFALALAVVRRRGRRGWKAIERAYVPTFGWADWL